MLKFPVLLVRDVGQTSRFFTDGLGLLVLRASDRWAELANSAQPSCPVLALKQVQGEAMSRAGYSPVLWFQVQDIDQTIPNLIMLGAVLDGPIKRPVIGKFASLRAPCGHMIGLHEESPFPDFAVND